MTWGNDAPFFVDAAHVLNFRLVLVYVIAIVSVTAIEMVYSTRLPWLRRAFLVTLLLIISSIALWIVLVFAHG